VPQAVIDTRLISRISSSAAFGILIVPLAIDVLGERLADYPWLVVNFFDHKVPMLTFLDPDVRYSDFGW
jgi:hypothetical protein